MFWSSKTIYVDKDTGEQITERHVTKGVYIILSTTIKNIKKDENYGIKHITRICEKNRQGNLF